VYVKAYQEAEISPHYVSNYQKAVTAVHRCQQNSPAFVELTNVCRFLAWVSHCHIGCICYDIHYVNCVSCIIHTAHRCSLQLH